MSRRGRATDGRKVGGAGWKLVVDRSLAQACNKCVVRCGQYSRTPGRTTSQLFLATRRGEHRHSQEKEVRLGGGVVWGFLILRFNFATKRIFIDLDAPVEGSEEGIQYESPLGGIREIREWGLRADTDLGAGEKLASCACAYACCACARHHHRWHHRHWNWERTRCGRGLLRHRRRPQNCRRSRCQG